MSFISCKFRKIESKMLKALRLSLVLLCLSDVTVRFVNCGCPFQNPFWFVEKPVVVNVFDEDGEMVPNKLRVMWGRMENFKCVDYFQVEYFQRLNPASTVQLTARINRHRRSVEVEVMPCTEYYFKVIASEDWKGLREDFKVFSEVVMFQAQYTPRFINQPMVKERGRRYKPSSGVQLADQSYMSVRDYQMPTRGRRQHQMYPSYQPQDFFEGPPPMPTTTTPEPETFSIKVAWRLSDVDYPICLDYFELDYFDTLFNESMWSRSFHRPFMKPKFEIEVSNQLVPCILDYEYIARAYGFNKQYTESVWTPPSCIRTTEAPSTTTEVGSTAPGAEEPEETTESLADKLKEALEENEKLEAKINGLKQEYEKIGLQVFVAFKESVFQGIEDFLARRKSEDSTGAVKNGNNSQPLFA